MTELGEHGLRRVGLGIVGLGYIGNIHLRHAMKLQNARVTAVADTSKRALREASGIGVSAYSDYDDLMKNVNVDAVIIALPTHLHVDCALRAAEAKKHIFIEKPIAVNVPDAKKIVKSAQKNGVSLMIGYPLRFDPLFTSVKRQIESGELGDVETAFASYISSGPFFHRATGYAPVPVPEWWFDPRASGGGVLMDLGCHLINLLRWYFGEITDVKSSLRHRFNLELEDSAVCLASFGKRTKAVLNVGWFSQQYLLRVELFGSVKHVIAEHPPQNPLTTAVQMLTTATSKFFLPHLSELQYFAQCVGRDLPPSPSGEEGVRDLEVISEAYRNAAL